MTAALKFLPDEAQMLQPADIRVTILRRKRKKEGSMTKTTPEWQIITWTGSQNYPCWISGCISQRCVIIFPAGPLTGAEMDFVFWVIFCACVILIVQDTSACRTAEKAMPPSAMMKSVPMGKM